MLAKLRGMTKCTVSNWKIVYRRASNYDYGSPNYVKISPLPHTESYAPLKILVVALASMFIGGKLAQKGAAFLEENEIFVHSEDDDDD